jgi:eukaryotic-like serine/threonine-protein kinase
MSNIYNESWTMFRGNPRRTGSIRTKPLTRPLLYWTIKLGPIISSPVYESGFLYVATMTGRIFCLDILRRQIKWHHNVGSPIVSSLLIMGDMIVCATFSSWISGDSLENNFVYCLDKNDGSVVWNVQMKGNFFSSPCPVGKNIALGSIDNNLYLLNSRGEIIWNFETGGQVWSSPSYHENMIYFGSDDGFVYSVLTDGSLRWKSKLNGKIRSSSPCVSEDSVYVGTHEGGMYSLNNADGIPKWNKNISKPILSSPLLVKDKVMFGTSNCTLYCFDLMGSKLWEFKTVGKIWSSPSSSEFDRLMFFGGLDSFIYGINSSTGKQEWKFPTMGAIDSSPCISNGMLFVGSRDGILYCFEMYRGPSYIH